MRARQSGIAIGGLFLAVACVGAFPRTACAELTGNVNVFLGAKVLDENDWSPVEHQSEFAVEFDFREDRWPLNGVIGLRGAHAEHGLGLVEVESTTSEVSFGVRKIWDAFPHARPFIGGGFSMIYAKAKASTVFGAGSLWNIAPGSWFGGGVYWALTPHLNLGFDLRRSSATASLGGLEGEAGGRHFGVLLGCHF